MRLGLLAACAAGLGLRLLGLQYGLPHVYNPDEVAIMARALSFAKGTLNPENFLYPTFFFYVLFVWVGVYVAFVWVSGRAQSLADVQMLYVNDPTGIYTAGRLLGALAGTAAIPAVYRLARHVTDSRAAIAAAFFLAVAPLAVRDSHYIKHDVPATLLVIAAYVLLLRVWPERLDAGSLRQRQLLAAAACGVAFSTHYYCVFLVVPLLLAVVMSTRDQGSRAVMRRTSLVLAISAAVFFLLSPFIALEPMTAWRDITANREIVVDRAVAQGPFAAVLRYVDMLVWDTAGLPVVLLAGAGIADLLRRQPAHALVLLAFPVPFFLFIANTFPASRYLNPLVPFIAVFAAHGVSRISAAISSRSLVFWVLVAASAAPALVQSMRTDLFLRRTDTRTIALEIVHSIVPAGTTVALQPYSTPLTPTREWLVRALERNLGAGAAPSPKFRLQLSQNPWPTPAYALVYLGRGLDAEKIYVDYEELGGAAGLAALRRHGVTHVVVKRYNRSDPETLPFLSALAREGRRLAVVSPYRSETLEADTAEIEPFLHNTDARIDTALERPGPALEIWQIDGFGP